MQVDKPRFPKRRMRTWFWLLILLLAACSHPPAEQQVRAAIADAQTAAESLDAGAFGDVLSDDFIGNEGSFDRRRLLGMLRLMRLRGLKLSVLTGPVSVQSRGSRLLAEFTATLGSGGHRLLPEHLGVYEVHTAWRLEGGDWKCYSARWKRKL